MQDRPSQTKYFIPPDNQRDLFVAGTLPVFAYLDVGVYGHPILEGRTPGVKIGYYNPPDVQRIKTRIASVEAFVEECMPALRGARSVDVSSSVYSPAFRTSRSGSAGEAQATSSRR
ncbi:MAG: hypothetical protein E6I22_11375 [Chloroflexi bacterium]|nr:MAG: hypothetical protein E6I22_11375 [Chloroflexota bacterium]